jgi:hypothetical protein
MLTQDKITKCIDLLDFTSCYGGYSFREVLISTGEDFAFGTGMKRYFTKEAYIYIYIYF